MKLLHGRSGGFLPQQVLFVHKEDDAFADGLIHNHLEQPQSFRKTIFSFSFLLLQRLVVVGQRNKEEDRGAVCKQRRPHFAVVTLTPDIRNAEYRTGVRMREFDILRVARDLNIDLEVFMLTFTLFASK